MVGAEPEPLAGEFAAAGHVAFTARELTAELPILASSLDAVVLAAPDRGALSGVLQAARRLLREKGRLLIAGPASDLPAGELVVALSEAGFVILRGRPPSRGLPRAQGELPRPRVQGRRRGADPSDVPPQLPRGTEPRVLALGVPGEPLWDAEDQRSLHRGRSAGGPLCRLPGALPSRGRRQASSPPRPPGRRHHDRARLPPRRTRADQPPRQDRPPLLRPVLRRPGRLQLRVQHREHPTLLDELRGRPPAGGSAVPRALPQAAPPRSPQPLLSRLAGYRVERIAHFDSRFDELFRAGEPVRSWLLERARRPLPRMALRPLPGRRILPLRSLPPRQAHRLECLPNQGRAPDLGGRPLRSPPPGGGAASPRRGARRTGARPGEDRRSLDHQPFSPSSGEGRSSASRAVRSRTTSASSSCRSATTPRKISARISITRWGTAISSELNPRAGSSASG